MSDLLGYAFWYLGRYAASEARLRAILRRRAERVARTAGDEVDRAALEAGITATLTRLREMGLLNDRAYAEQRARALARQGRSTNLIARELAARGVARETIGQALAGLAEEADEDLDLVNARAYARRRRLGIYALTPTPEDRRQRDLQKLIRAGYSYRVARRALEEEPPGP